MEPEQWTALKQQSVRGGPDVEAAFKPYCQDAYNGQLSGDHKIKQILSEIRSLSPVEKFLLCLKLPAEVSNIVDPFRQPLNPLGSRSEINRTITWIRTHLIEDPDISLQKQQVYEEYNVFCMDNKMKPLSQADFGKVMKQVYPRVRARRLGTRGNSRYCYSGLSRRVKLETPSLPDLTDKPLSTEAPFTQWSVTSAAWLIVKEWSKQQLGVEFNSLQNLAHHLVTHHSIGADTEAAFALSSDPSRTEDLCKVDPKHREMQMQLQRKIHQKDKEKKRKIQSEKNGVKKQPRSQSATAALVSPGSSSSPTQGPLVCDKLELGKPELNGKVPIAKLPPTKKSKSSNNKYKAIQPGLQQPCDTATYNLQQPPAQDNRSQLIDDKFKTEEDDNEEDLSVPITRERLNSISTVQKDDLDEYLGTNNSQHEEELSQYFKHNNNDTLKLSNLRQLLQQNGIKLKKPEEKPEIPHNYTAPLQATLNARRRVSFETQTLEETVPPSPNTRRKNFSFTPISPGPQSPGLASKCSSTSASPFVSPRNTPIPHRTSKLHKLKIKKEDLEMEASMSAPSSPMLQKLLNSNSKVAYRPGYTTQQSVPLQCDEIFFPNEYRSQSVPLHQMALKQNFDQAFLSHLDPPGDFTEADPIAETETDNVNRIINSLDDPQNNNNNDIFMVMGEGQDLGYGVNMEYGFRGMQQQLNPSKSVPSTPLPFPQGHDKARSYPSTPLAVDTFAFNSDCLLNGQPIRGEVGGDFMDFATAQLEEGLEEGQDFGIMEGIDDNGLMQSFNGGL